VLFYTYIYEPTARGVPIVPERAALISTAHDEAPLHLAPYRALFQLPRAFGFLTPEERDLVHRTFRNEHIPHETLGLGLDAPGSYDIAEFRAAHKLDGPLVLYLGQVSEGKGCGELLEAWTAYRSRPNARPATLVLAGTVRMELPDRPDVVALGRIPDAQKYAALAAADAVVLPSRFESLGIVLLEAWQVGTPVVVRADNLVTGRTGRSVRRRCDVSRRRQLRRRSRSRDRCPRVARRGRARVGGARIVVGGVRCAPVAARRADGVVRGRGA
jgi:glycosyltransferase involved in cell wall biosynthesis